MASQFTPYAPIGALNNADVFAVEQRTGHAFGRDYRYYVATCKDGAEYRLRSVTSVLGVLNKEALIQWAVDQSMDYIRELVDYDADGVARFTQPDLEALLRKARMAHYRTKTEAAELGTIAHDYVEAFLRTGEEQDMSDQDARVANCYGLFRRWWDQAGLSVIQTELMVYHAPLGYAGQLDFLAADQAGNPVLVDWKTSKHIYWNYKLQVVAYARALHAMGRGVVSGIRIVRIGREDAEFEVLDVPRSEWKQLGNLFQSCIALSDAFRDAEREYKKSRRKAGQEVA
jgi:hypothetical protein